VLTVAVVTKPFPFEGAKRAKIAEEGIEELSKYVDSLITIPNAKLLKVLGKGVSLLDAFKEANNVLLGAVQGIAELITRPGLINVDFADVRTVMAEMGMAMMGSGVGQGQDRAQEAAEAAISSPLLEDIDIAGARGILVNVTAGMDISIEEFERVGSTVREFADPEATIVVGTVIDPDMSGELRVTVVATGLESEQSIDAVEPAEKMSVIDGGAAVLNAGGNVASMKARTPVEAVAAGKGLKEKEMAILDIPSFLRKQAD